MSGAKRHHYCAVRRCRSPFETIRHLSHCESNSSDSLIRAFSRDAAPRRAQDIKPRQTSNFKKPTKILRFTNILNYHDQLRIFIEKSTQFYRIAHNSAQRHVD
jgi:hypothetical protein